MEVRAGTPLAGGTGWTLTMFNAPWDLRGIGSNLNLLDFMTYIGTKTVAEISVPDQSA